MDRIFGFSGYFRAFPIVRAGPRAGCRGEWSGIGEILGVIAGVLAGGWADFEGGFGMVRDCLNQDSRDYRIFKIGGPVIWVGWRDGVGWFDS